MENLYQKIVELAEKNLTERGVHPDNWPDEMYDEYMDIIESLEDLGTRFS